MDSRDNGQHVAHLERHGDGMATIRDIILGMSDGLTVPFALAAGLSGAASNTGIIIAAGLAEIAAGSISMGLGGYLAGRSEVEHYTSERQREEREIIDIPQAEKDEVSAIFHTYGLSAEETLPVVESLSRRPRDWINFMMHFELCLDEPNPRRAIWSALTIAVSYVIGGIIPLAPYMFTTKISAGLSVSIVVTLTALFLFGYVKGCFTGTSPLRSAAQTLLIGGLAAAAAFALARLVTQ